MAKASDPIITPSEDEVPALTDRLATIETEISSLTDEKKGIKARLEAYALQQRGEHLADENREGRKVTLTGRRWSFPVLFTSDLLIKSFKAESPKHKELRDLLRSTTKGKTDAEADQQLKLFFDAPNTWAVKQEDGQKFRAAAAEWLPEDVAPVFIAACTQCDKHGVKKSNAVFDMKAMKEVA